MDWVTAAMSGLSALLGGIVGGMAAAYRLGRRHERTENRLSTVELRLQEGADRVRQVPALTQAIEDLSAQIAADFARVEARLEKGDLHIANVPVLAAKIDALVESQAELKIIVRATAQESVTHEECTRRHERDGS